MKYHPPESNRRAAGIKGGEQKAMGHLSFRIKLLLALMTVVAGVTAVALWVTQRQVVTEVALTLTVHTLQQMLFLVQQKELI